jgi:hypothetical protein
MPFLPWRWTRHSRVVAVLLHAHWYIVGGMNLIPEEVYTTILGGLGALAVIWEDWTDWTIGRRLWPTRYPAPACDQSEEDIETEPLI